MAVASKDDDFRFMVIPPDWQSAYNGYRDCSYGRHSQSDSHLWFPHIIPPKFAFDKKISLIEIINHVRHRRIETLQGTKTGEIIVGYIAFFYQPILIINY